MGRILLVDDEAASRLVLQNRLRELGHEVVPAENGAKGLIQAREVPFDLILIEAMLGSGVSGIEVCRRIRQIPQAALALVVMIARSSVGKDEVHQGYEAGCDAFVTKSSDKELLEDVLRAMLRIKAQRDELAQQLRVVDNELRRRQQERPEGEREPSNHRDNGEHSLALRELGAGHPDGLLLVDAEGIVRHADRGARDLLGAHVEGRNLGKIAPATGLEAFVRDAHNEVREGFRFDLRVPGAKTSRSLCASVVPLVGNPGERDPGMRVVLFLDAGKRKLCNELMRAHEPTIPHSEVGVLLDAARFAFSPATLVGESATIRAARSFIAELGPTLEPVLIVGGPGTGKQHLARAMHFSSAFSGPFVSISCAAFTPANLEVELFGQVRGPSNSGQLDRPGVFQQAHHGSIYLSNIDQLDVATQRKLLRAIAEGEVTRVGGVRAERVEVRVIASTRIDLEAAVAKGAFLPELLERLARHPVELALLAERPGDVPLLAKHFLVRFGSSKNEMEIAPEALAALEAHGWPGNVREFEDTMQRACRAATSHAIGLNELPPSLRDAQTRLATHELTPQPRPRISIGNSRGPQSIEAPQTAMARASSFQASVGALNPWDIADEEPVSLELYESKCLQRALHETGGDKLAAARLLNVGKSTLYRKLKKYNIR